MAKKMTYPPFRPVHPGGRPLKYTPKELAEKFSEYVEWANENPLETGYSEEISYVKTKRHLEHSETKPRMVSIRGFLVWLGTDMNWWYGLPSGKRGEEFSRVIARIKDYCEHYQTELASAGIYKENIIARLLGLVDKSSVTTKGDAVTVVVRSDEEKDRIEKMKELEV